MKSVKDLVKHSSIYGIGQILSRFASVLLLPLYTRCLSTSDYGCVAILDLTAGILAILIGGGVAQAVVRFHFEDQGENSERRAWWTGLTWVVACATLIVTPMILCRGLLAELTLNPTVGDGSFFYLLAISTLWCNTIASLVETWLRVRKWSGVFVVVSFGRLLLNISLNVWFLVGLELGVTGLLVGNLIAAAVNTLVLVSIFARTLRGFLFDSAMLRQLLVFGAPLIVTALLSLLMHEADRYFLKHFAGLAEVGVYSLAYKVGQAVNMLFLIPFSAIWNVVMYEMAADSEPQKNYARVFEYFTYALLILTLAASLFAYPLLPLLTPGEYSQAADLIPIILLAYMLYAMHQQFCVPALLAKRTAALIPASIAGVVVNVVLNLLLI
ncbi:MAG: oligosaccharide flippase family protein, partial [Planctomycetaceae bacterium]|nr:oligosaccharide flippase family protein [Planctomycetaceae bacterium]